MKKEMQQVTDIIATWFFSGKSPKAPGTAGSFCTLPLVILLYSLGFWGILGASILLFLIGWWATDCILKVQENQDPAFVVIDEVVGQTLAFLIVSVFYPLSWWMLLIGFALFRFFDIVKVWPASFFDKKVHSAFGVMMDDVVAGIYAALVLFGICFVII